MNRTLFTFLLLSLVVLVQGDKIEFKLDDGALIQIACTDGNPGGICYANGELGVKRAVPNSGESTYRDYHFEHGTGLRCECDNNGPADAIECEGTCTCKICIDGDEDNCTEDCEVLSAASMRSLIGIFSISIGVFLMLWT